MLANKRTHTTGMTKRFSAKNNIIMAAAVKMVRKTILKIPSSMTILPIFSDEAADTVET